MDKSWGRIQAVKDAADSQKGLLWILEILIYIALFLICQFAMLIVMFPVMFVKLFLDADFIKASMSLDYETMMEVEAQLLNGDGFMIFTLFIDIIMIVLVCLFCKLFQKRKMSTLGFCKKGAVKEYLIGAVAGAVVFSLAVLGSVATGAMKIEGNAADFSIGIFIVYLLGFMIQGMAEEVLCRGYFMVSFARRYPMIIAVLVNSIGFGIFHLANPGMTPLAMVNLCLFGIFASLYFIKRGNIWGIGAFHSIWNFIQGNVYGIQVSGTGELNSLCKATPVEGKELLSGGAFGLEGSILVTIVLCIGILILYFWKKEKNSVQSEKNQ